MLGTFLSRKCFKLGPLYECDPITGNLVYSAKASLYIQFCRFYFYNHSHFKLVNVWELHKFDRWTNTRLIDIYRMSSGYIYFNFSKPKKITWLRVKIGVVENGLKDYLPVAIYRIHASFFKRA